MRMLRLESAPIALIGGLLASEVLNDLERDILPMQCLSSQTRALQFQQQLEASQIGMAGQIIRQ